MIARIQASNAENYGMLIGGLILMGFGSTGTLFPSILFNNHSLARPCSHQVYPIQALLPLVPWFIPQSRILCRHRLEPDHLVHCQEHRCTHVNHQRLFQNATVSVYTSNLADIQTVTRGTSKLAAGYNSSLQSIIPSIFYF